MFATTLTHQISIVVVFITVRYFKHPTAPNIRAGRGVVAVRSSDSQSLWLWLGRWGTDGFGVAVLYDLIQAQFAVIRIAVVKMKEVNVADLTANVHKSVTADAEEGAAASYATALKACRQL